MKKYEKVIKDLEAKFNQLSDYVQEKIDGIDDEKKAQIDELLQKTGNAINASVTKIKEIADEKIDEEKVNEFFDKVVSKAEEAVDFTKAKVNEIINEDPNKNLDKVFENLAQEFDKVRQSDVFKKANDVLKELGATVNEFLSKPEVKEAINKAKVTTVNIAEKGYQGLKKVLNTDEETTIDEVVEEVVKEEPKKKTTKKAAPKKATTKKTTKK